LLNVKICFQNSYNKIRYFLSVKSCGDVELEILDGEDMLLMSLELE